MSVVPELHALMGAILEKIRNNTHDPEVAHALEAALWLAALQAIATGAPARETAAIALRSREIEFDRWFA